MLVDKQTYFENYNHQQKLYQEKNLNQVFAVLLFILLCFYFFFCSYFLSFPFKSVLYVNPEILDSLTNFLLCLHEV